MPCSRYAPEPRQTNAARNRAAVPAFILATREELDRCSVPATIVGHVGDGNFHLIFSIDPDAGTWTRIVADNATIATGANLGLVFNNLLTNIANYRVPPSCRLYLASSTRATGSSTIQWTSAATWDTESPGDPILTPIAPFDAG